MGLTRYITAFYDELARYAALHPDAPLYLVQGAYFPDESYAEGVGTLLDPAVDDAFAQELLDVQGSPVDLGGYYHPDDELTSAAMRPSATFNAVIDELRG